MKASDISINKSINEITVFLVKQISMQYHITEQESLTRLITTTTYMLLQNKSSKLYAESPEYVLDMLVSEINGNLNEWMKL